MKVKFLKSVASLYGAWGRGEVVDLRDEVGKEFVRDGYCEEIKPKKPSKRAKTTSSRQSKKSEKR